MDVTKVLQFFRHDDRKILQVYIDQVVNAQGRIAELVSLESVLRSIFPESFAFRTSRLRGILKSALRRGSGPVENSCYKRT